jgi:hypothetical protein
MVKFLLENGADPKIGNPYDIASSQANNKVVKLLKQAMES